MISPSTQTRRGTPKFFRGLLVFYVVRHLLGVGLFLWLLNMAVSAAGPLFSVIMLLLTFVYVGYAVYGTRKIYRQYQASVRRREREGG